MDTLSQLFGSALKVKLMRLFLFNKGVAYDAEYIADKTGAKQKDIEKDVASLRKVGLVKSAKLSRIVVVKSGKKSVEKRKAFRAWTLDGRFEFAEALSDFLVKTHSLEDRAIVRRLGKVGRVKAVLVSGIFVRDSESRIDMFVVADGVRQAAMDKVVKSIESDMGKEIRYALMSAADFEYRVSMNDKLVRDVMDFPHKVLSNKLGTLIK